MKIYIYEPEYVQSGTNLNKSERVDHFLKVLDNYDISELRINKIYELKEINSVHNLDDSSNLILAHYRDVQTFFPEMKNFEKAICIFHCYNSDWKTNKIKSNSACLSINNEKNRFCIYSTELKENIETFVAHFVETGKIDFRILEGFYSEEK